MFYLAFPPFLLPSAECPSAKPRVNGEMVIVLFIFIEKIAVKQKIINSWNDFYKKMASSTVTISREEYERLKKFEEVDNELLNQLVSSLEDIKSGRIKRVC